VLEVKRQVGTMGEPYAIGLRLSDAASRELAGTEELERFRAWLSEHGCYVFTINGFPFGRFHGAGVKERVYLPDWSSAERVEYTNRLLRILAALLPDGVDGSVSTAPVSFKAFDGPRLGGEAWERTARENLWRCIDEAARIEKETGKCVRIAIEPEPLCYLETTEETIAFIDRMRADRPGDGHARQYLGVNYDACHLAVEYEDARQSLELLRNAGIDVVKLHLSSALKVEPTPAIREKLRLFCEPTYLHQVVARTNNGFVRYTDLPDALAADAPAEEWRIHFHVPLHHPGGDWYQTTADHLRAVLDWLAEHPSACTHLEMETYTWGVLPDSMRTSRVEEQVAKEYRWTLAELNERALA
jgi:sugar phosphate isomerase/epimerase